MPSFLPTMTVFRGIMFFFGNHDFTVSFLPIIFVPVSLLWRAKLRSPDRVAFPRFLLPVMGWWGWVRGMGWDHFGNTAGGGPITPQNLKQPTLLIQRCQYYIFTCWIRYDVFHQPPCTCLCILIYLCRKITFSNRIRKNLGAFSQFSGSIISSNRCPSVHRFGRKF